MGLPTKVTLTLIPYLLGLPICGPILTRESLRHILAPALSTGLRDGGLGHDHGPRVWAEVRVQKEDLFMHHFPTNIRNYSCTISPTNIKKTVHASFPQWASCNRHYPSYMIRHVSCSRHERHCLLVEKARQGLHVSWVE